MQSVFVFDTAPLTYHACPILSKNCRKIVEIRCFLKSISEMLFNEKHPISSSFFKKIGCYIYHDGIKPYGIIAMTLYFSQGRIQLIQL